jgi:hypothetical protein
VRQATLSQCLFDFTVEVTEYQEKQEMKIILQAHEEMINDNRSNICTVSVKVHDNEQRVISQVASIMGLLAQLKQQVVNLETGCTMLRNLAVQLSKNVNSGASNQMTSDNSEQGEPREEDTVQQLFEAMDISEHEPELLDQGPDEATSCNIF